MNVFKLRFVLAGIILLLIGVIITAIILLQGLLKDQVVLTDHMKIDADVSEQEILKLKKLESELSKKQDVVERAKQIAASVDQYQFQDQVINDLTVYAQRSGFGISSFDFTQSTGQKPGTVPSDKTSFVVNLTSPIPYDRFLQFIHAVELNLTKIQIISVTLSPNTKNTSEILNPTINLEVFLKK